MSQELLKLKSNTGHKNETASRGFKKRYFFQNVDLIFELVEKDKVGYADIVEAMKKDGVIITNQYFRRLMAAEKQKRVNNGKLPAKPVESKSHRAGLGDSPEPLQEKTDSNLTPLEQSIKDEVDKIKASDMSPSQKREALAKATAPLKNRNPLTNR